MANFTEVSRIEADSEIARAAIALVLMHSPLLNFYDKQNAFEQDATDFNWWPAHAVSTIQSRARDGAYSISAVAPGSKQTGALYMLGDGVHIDETDIADMELGLGDVNKHLLAKLQKVLRSFTRQLEDKMFNGTGITTEIPGLVTIFDGTTDIPGWATGNKGVVDARDYIGDGTANSFDLTTADNYDAFMEAWDAWVALVEDPVACLVNRKMRAKLTTIAKAKGRYTETLDSFGKQVQQVDGLPILPMYANSIPITEDDDTAVTPVAETTSLWFMSPGEARNSIVTNSGLAFKDYDPDDKQSEGHTWETRFAWKFEEENSALRVRNIKIKDAA